MTEHIIGVIPVDEKPLMEDKISKERHGVILLGLKKLWNTPEVTGSRGFSIGLSEKIGRKAGQKK